MINGIPYLKAHVRWMIRRDLAEIVEIEHSSSSPRPWSEEDFVRVLRQRNCIGMVAEHDNIVIGFMVYETHRGDLRLLNLAVDPAFRRQVVGSRLLAKLDDKFGTYRERIVAEVRESALPAQLFLRAYGYRASRVLRGYYGDTGEDAYEMVRLRQDAIA